MSLILNIGECCVWAQFLLLLQNYITKVLICQYYNFNLIIVNTYNTNYSFNLKRITAMEKKDVANRIKVLREAKKMTQNALANAAGVSPTYIYQLERGEKSPTIEYLDHICWGLGITLHDFFNEPTELEDLVAVISSLSLKQRTLLIAFLKSIEL